MNTSLLLWALLATGIFWGVGVYNRLTRLRARAMEAFGPLEKCMQSYSALIEAHVYVYPVGSGSDELDAKAETEWLTLKAQAEGLVLLLKECKPLPLSMQALQPLQVGHTQLQSAWKCLIDTPADLAGGVVPESMRLQWDAATIKTQIAWETLQDAVQELGDAVAQFPARLMAASMDLKAKNGH